MTIISSPTNLPVSVTYGGSSQPPVKPGTYQVVATSTDPNEPSSTEGWLTISQASATLALSQLTQISDGSPKCVQVQTQPANLAITLTYNGQNRAPTIEGVYTVQADVVDPNYAGSVTGTLTIIAATNALVLSWPNTTNAVTPRTARIC